MTYNRSGLVFFCCCFFVVVVVVVVVLFFFSILVLSTRTSFGQKYDLFSLLGTLYIVRKVTSLA